MQGKSFHGYPVLGRYAEAGRFPDALFSTWIGGTGTYLNRPRVIAELNLPPERFVTLVHPTSCVSRRARLGRGVVIYQNCTASSNVVLGDHVLVLPNSILSHDDEIGDYTLITGGVAISGSVKVGRSCYLGTNCAIHQGVTIGEGSLIGMGSVVRHDVPPYSVVVGNPARLLREAQRPES
jgi:sugar O-acyltransferase (sialic acid O-acetyltransferase NeuD family)